MSKTKHVWSEEDNAGLREFVAGGGSANRASARFKRSVNAVQMQAKKLGVSFPSFVEQRRKRQVILADR